MDFWQEMKNTIAFYENVLSSAGKKKNMTNAALPFLFLLLHVSYGVGTLKGLLSKTDCERK